MVGDRMKDGTERGVWLSEDKLNEMANDLCCKVNIGGYSTVGAAMSKIEGIKTMQTALLEMISGKCDMEGPEYWSASYHTEWPRDYEGGSELQMVLRGDTWK